MINEIDKTYIAALEDPNIGYAIIAPDTIITHLMNTYGTVTTENLKENHNQLNDE